MVDTFDKALLKKLYKPDENSSGEENGQVTIIGGSKLFHGAPLLSLKVASRVVDMVFFTSPEPSVGAVAEQIKSKLLSFIWIPWEDVEAYIQKSDAVLIGPGMMRYRSENKKSKVKNQNDKSKFKILDADKPLDGEGRKTREITKRLLLKFPEKKWVIDAGSLQTMDEVYIPSESILTPNVKEFELLFKLKTQNLKLKSTIQKSKLVQEKARQYNCTIVLKGPETIVCSPSECVIVKGGNAGMTKGGTGDVLAGLTVALLSKNNPFLAASVASYIAKAAANELLERVGTNYNADDLADKIPKTLQKVTS